VNEPSSTVLGATRSDGIEYSGALFEVALFEVALFEVALFEVALFEVALFGVTLFGVTMGEPALKQHELATFFVELEALGKEIRSQVSQEDLHHLQRIERWGRACTAAGWATSWMGPNLFSAFMLSQGRFTRWTVVAHHVCHEGLGKVPDIPDRYTRKGFAQGWRRPLDWFDVILPEGWHEEHDVLHHSRTGETADPDLVEDNLGWLRDSDLPVAVRYAMVGVMASVWKWIYYAPNTLQVAFAAQAKRQGLQVETLSLLDVKVWDPRTETGRILWSKSFLPYVAWHFLVIPSLFLPLGPLAVASAATNSLLAELITNLHSFLVITTNHAGDDVARFDGPSESLQDFQYRQIVGSVNYRTGGDLNDWLHGWLNYQIEHHVWPDLTPLQYRKVQPRLKDLCARHGVSYVQESVWKRLRKTLHIMVGKTSMRKDPGLSLRLV
jgi:fatty acid desaturase